MKHKNLLLWAAFAAVALAACSPQADPENPDSGPEDGPSTEMSLTVTINQGTRAGYAIDGDVLKTSWDAQESITLITMGRENGKEYDTVRAVDIFTSNGEAGRTVAEFTGTYTDGDHPSRIYVLYPALVPVVLTPTMSKWKSDFINELSTGTDQMYISYAGPCGDTIDALKQFLPMSGAAEISGIKNNRISATVSHLSSVFRFNFSFAEVYRGKALKKMTLDSYAANDENAAVAGKGIFNKEDWILLDWFAESGFPKHESAEDHLEFPLSLTIPDSGELSLFFAHMNVNDVAKGDLWFFSPVIDGMESVRVGEHCFPDDTSFSHGKVYTFDIEFQAPDSQ